MQEEHCHWLADDIASSDNNTLLALGFDDFKNLAHIVNDMTFLNANIKALVATREEDNLDIFRTFMFSMMQKNLQNEIDVYLSSVGEVHEDEVLYQKSGVKNIKSREKIIALLAENGKLSAVALAERIGISAKAVEKHLANLKADGILKRIGPDRGGHWEVIE